MENIINIKEILLQKLIYKVFFNYNKELQTVDGKTLKIISIGNFNSDYGPDFSNSCILIDNELKIGDIEVHKRSSDWINHKHYENRDYDNIILHIVLDNDKDFSKELDIKFDTLLLDKEEILLLIEQNNNSLYSFTNNINIDCSKFALKRLLKKTIEVYYLLLNNNLEKVLLCSVHTFLSRYYYRRRRKNLYKDKDIISIMESVKDSNLYKFLINLKDNKIEAFNEEIKNVLNNKIFNEGKHLRMELFINCVFPIAFCIADINQKKNLLFWYWQEKVICRYQKLTYSFPDQSQKYIWQQQGLLELLKEKELRAFDVIKDAEDEFYYHIDVDELTFDKLSYAPFYIN